MLKFDHNQYRFLSSPAIYSPLQWVSFTFYEWLPKFPRYAPNPFLMNPAYFYEPIAWHNRYATVFPHSKKYRMLRAITTNDLQEVRKLLDQGFPINVQIQDKYGYNALQIAAVNNHYPLIEMLVLRGAEVDRKDRWGNTPLTIAVTNQNHEAIHSLMRNGSNPNVPNKYGLTALDKAINNPSIQTFIQQYTEKARGFPRFRLKLRLQEVLKRPFWTQVASMPIYSGKVRENLMSKWQFDFTDNRTVEELLGKGLGLIDFYNKV